MTWYVATESVKATRLLLLSRLSQKSRFTSERLQPQDSRIDGGPHPTGDYHA